MFSDHQLHILYTYSNSLFEKFQENFNLQDQITIYCILALFSGLYGVASFALKNALNKAKQFFA
jgi:hypothetical protein